MGLVAILSKIDNVKVVAVGALTTEETVHHISSPIPKRLTYFNLHVIKNLIAHN